RLERLLAGAPAGWVVARTVDDGRWTVASPHRSSSTIHRPQATTRPEGNRLHFLEVRGLTYRYPASGHGIEGIDLWLPRGSFTVVTGRLGAGKTTLLRVLLGLLPRDAGAIVWNGRPV